MSSTGDVKPAPAEVSSEKSGIESHASVNTLSDGDEKDRITTVKEVTAASSSDEEYTDPEDIADIPELVRNIVSFEDDPTLPVITFRSVLLSAIFCIIGSFVSQLT